MNVVSKYLFAQKNDESVIYIYVITKENLQNWGESDTTQASTVIKLTAKLDIILINAIETALVLWSAL